jgi:hypothetical protein
MAIAALLLRFIAACPKRFFLPLVRRIWHRPLSHDANQTTRMPRNGHPCRTICVGLEHPWPHALGDHRLPGTSAGDPPEYREDKSSLRETSLVREPMAARLQEVPAADRDMVLFMQVARWPDDIRIKDRQHNRGPWHYINWPFKPEGQPATVETREPEPVNILTAMAENERVSSFILWVTYTNPYTLLSYSLLSIPRATEDGKVDCHRLSGQLLCSRCRRVKRNFLSLGT